MIWYFHYQQALDLIEARRLEVEQAQLARLALEGIRRPSLAGRFAGAIVRSIGRTAIRVALAIDPTLVEADARQPDRPRAVRI